MTADKGRELERRIADFFTLNGYSTRQNVILEGRSGGKHEIDVLAEKSDGVTTFRLAVECKAWNTPIEKETVAKLDYVLRDLGVNKGLIVALTGWRTGADQSAQQLGIELWGPHDLESRLGQVALAQLQSGPAQQRATGFPLIQTREQVERAILSQSKGRLGLGREEIVGTEQVWLPFFLLEIACAREDKQRFRRPSVKTRSIWNAYEAFEGHFYASWDTAPQLSEVQVTIAVRPRVKESAVVGTLRQTFAKAAEVVRADAQQRYGAKLAALGIPLPVSSVSVEAHREFYWPFFVARLRARGGERLVSVDGVLGQVQEGLGRVLTAHQGYVVETVRQAHQST